MLRKIERLLNKKILIAISSLFLSYSNFSFSDEASAQCAQFKSVLSTPAGLLKYALEDIVDDRGIRRVPNLDIDGDGLIDVVYWSCPGQGSPVPADPCEMSIELSSGKKIKFEEYGFYLALYKDKVYAVHAQSGRNRVAGQGKIYRVNGSGVKLICSKL